MGIVLKKRHSCFWLKDSLTSEQDLMHDTVSPEGFKVESTEYRGFHKGRTSSPSSREGHRDLKWTLMKLNPSTNVRALKGICTSDRTAAYFILISDLEDVKQKMVGDCEITEVCCFSDYWKRLLFCRSMGTINLEHTREICGYVFGEMKLFKVTQSKFLSQGHYKDPLCLRF